MSTTTSRKETERTKLIQEKCQTLLTQMLRDEDNKYCVDCDAKGPRWASWNLGVFLCIRCAGIHRNLGVHISRVKSVNLDTWTPEQVISLQQMGNSRARAVYEAQLPDSFRRPQTDTALESFIRAKYEHKKYLAREWVPPPPPKVDWAKEIDEELEKQKRKKKAAQACSALGLSSVMSGGSSEKKSSSSSLAKSTPLPAPLPKPKGSASGHSPKTHRISTSSTAGGDSNHTNDLLGLASPTKPTSSGNGGVSAGSQDFQNDSFSGFLSATPAAQTNSNVAAANDVGARNAQNCNTQNSLAKEEEDFFNQGSLGGGAGDKDKSGKLTKDSILALYGTAPTNAISVGTHNPHSNPQMNFGQPQQPMFTATGAFTGMAPGYMTTGGVPHPQQPQFMTPPNSVSMYNAPVMTAPTAFTAPGMGGGMHMGGNVGGGFGAQFGISGAASAGSFPQHSMTGMGSMMPSSGIGGGGGGGIMATGQTMTPANINLMQTNQSLLSGISMTSMATQPQLTGSNMGMTMPVMGSMPAIGTMSTAATYQASSASATNSLNQQFGNLNIGNVWQ